MPVASPTLATGNVDRRKWTPEEDALLTQAMSRFQHTKEIRWTEIAAQIPERSAKACRKRWVNGLNDRLKKGSWTHEEDRRLREGVALLSSDWARIADLVGQRSGDQCSKRWREVLDPAINKSSWTAEEDRLLIELFHKHGSAWQVISTNFCNRRALQCRNRCCKLLSLHSYPRAKKSVSDTIPKDTVVSSLPSQPFSSPGVSPTSPSFFEPLNHSPTAWSTGRIDSNTMQGAIETNSPPCWMPASVPSVPFQAAGQHALPTNLAPETSFLNLKVPSCTESIEVPSEFGESGNLLLEQWKKVQGFSSSIRRKEPPSALNLSQSTYQPVTQHDTYSSPLVNTESPSLCSSISTSPTTPSVADPLSAHGLMPSPMEPAFNGQAMDGMQLPAPIPSIPSEKDYNSPSWQVFCDNLVALQASQSVARENPLGAGWHAPMLGQSNGIDSFSWLTESRS
ncbi:hypothetical protein MYAM1_000183 [Malassezia yamatoensis]|uniref:Uncharacterized protein n=1 Tax=Malassezia yamatoensis TaxID=253288 RepID=A0AAJ6CF97_9BASI|nr:hypothetical protein MYAM1_000183 [Malassezia yamatoensis]